MMSTKSSAGSGRRVRRSAEASRALLLDVAERRLAEHGVGGLAIADVAGEAGMSHGTLLHHFGSSEGMRHALVSRMADGLLDEILALETSAERPRAQMQGFFEHLFARLAAGGHARLIAWLSLSHSEDGRAQDPLAASAERLEHLVTNLADRLRLAGRSPDPERSARYTVLLVISSAIGLGVARDSLLPGLALDAGDEKGYARWLAAVIGAHVEPEQSAAAGE